MSLKIFKVILFLSMCYLGYVFISASLDKIMDPVSFSKSINNYEITPYWINNLVALILPWIELICGFLMIISIIGLYSNRLNFVDIANNLIILMLLWFVFILSIAIFRGLDIDCGCGLNEDKTLPIDRLIKDIYLLIMSIIIKFRVRIMNFLSMKD
tara:strand:+ start:113 stop:580 length:468 start_codon:yes stop_codon:yes gene_type:complete